MNEIEIRLFATLREGRFARKKMKINGVERVEDLIRKLDMKPEEVAIIFVNKRHARPDTKIHPGDIISFFPKIGGG